MPKQQSPAEGLDLKSFPRRVVRAETVWERAHKVENEPWYFASSGAGRFDLTEPLGTCYLANTAETAAREVVGPDFVASGLVPDTFLEERVISSVELPTGVSAAKLTSSEVFAYRISNELCSISDYGVSQDWAGAFHEAGFTGIWYQPRFAAGKGRALGIFGASGSGDCKVQGRKRLCDVVRETLDIRAASTKSLDEYEIVDTPHT
ncbi:RES family NAD+ phosphorylase [Nesterenkonia sp. AN1]|uniref:RES family NAD+ phosphorylase n=1 Tax=Nesterenkonia sp. AN1 TaxID=652017 RepID=UPI001376D901